MERKYLLFVNSMNRAESKLHDALEKLLYYMEKSEKAGIVPHEKIEADI